MSERPATLIQAHVLISGNVQGVGYRYWTRQQAQQLGIKGWVRNLSDQRVEACFEGDRLLVEQLIQACYDGPPHASVTNISRQFNPPEGWPNFEILASLG